jgi:hypothetical protein
MNRKGFQALSVIAFLLCTTVACFGWGGDIQIYPGQINAFDVDYDFASGNMFVAFQATGENVIRLYASTDHGENWGEIATFLTNPFSGTSPRSDLSRLRVLFQGGRVHVFWVDSLGYLNRWGCSATGGAKGGSHVSQTVVLESSFAVAVDNNSGRMFAGWRDAASRQIVRYSDDGGITWHDKVNWSTPAGAPPQDLTYGPGVAGDHISWVFGTQYYGAVEEIQYFRLPSAGGVWDESQRITNNAYYDYDPRVAAANVNDSGVWILYNRDRGGHEIDLMQAYSTDGGVTWGAPSAVAAADGIDEYIADVKFYKGYPNQYVDMVYIRDDPAANPVRQAVWAWASTGAPVSWQGNEVFSDADVQAWPPQTAPRLVYSPGATASGSGVVFSYFGASGLYFDSPWNHAPVGAPLSVTIHGSGAVQSSPAGINCTNGTIGGQTICTHAFAQGTAVALTAAPVDGADYTSYFINWTGDCTGSNPACAVVTNGALSVQANFAALGIPVFALPVPMGANAWSYAPTVAPVSLPDPADCQPFAVGDLTTGNISLQIGLPAFSGGVDVYVGFQSDDALSPGVIYVVDETGGIVALSDGMPTWRTNVSSATIDEALFGDIPLAALPAGLYHLYLLVVPTGETDLSNYYFWATYFLNQ